MLYGSEKVQMEAFADRIAATAIVNQASIKCLIDDVSINEENIVRRIGDFADPSRPDASGLIEAIMRAIDQLVGNSSSSMRDLNG